MICYTLQLYTIEYFVEHFYNYLSYNATIYFGVPLGLVLGPIKLYMLQLEQAKDELTICYRIL